jgi:hypothetical protein
MILFNIIQSSEKKAEELSLFLIEKKYALQTHIDINTMLSSDNKKHTIRLFFITKALLYTIIENEIKEKFNSEEMIIYATPVSHINEEFSEVLRSQIKAV